MLTTQSAQRLGEISYGIYLLQGIVLFSFVQIPDIKPLVTSTTIHYWLFMLIEAITLVTIAFFAYRFIEKPCIDLGKKAVSALLLIKVPHLVQVKANEG